MLNPEKALELCIASREDITKSLELEELLKEEIREKLAQQKGGNTEKKRLKAAEKYIKNTKKNLEHNKKLHGSWEVDEKQYFSNSYSGFEISNKIEGLEHVEGMPALKDIIKGYKDKLNIKRELPDITELKIQYKEAIAEEKACNKKAHIKKFISNKRYFNLGESWFDIKLFTEILDIITGKIKLYGGENAMDGLIVTNEEDYAILLPVRMKEENQQEKNRITAR